MTDQPDRTDTRADTRAETRRAPGYRGALTERDDRLARPWVAIVIALFLLMLVLSALGVPSRFEAEPTINPVPSLSPSGSPAASPS